MLSKSLFTAIAVALFAGSIASPLPDSPTEIDATLITAPPQANPDPVDELAFDALQELQVLESEGGFSRKRSEQCSLRNIAVRREWSSLSEKERKSYTDAVLCLMEKPSRIDPVQVPGARSRYDDFVAVHIQKTTTIHATANFLTWHRHYTWLFEQALRNECGYTGYQPYWNWGASAADPLASKVFDGSPYSLSGDGEFIPHNGSRIGGGQIAIPPGNGGGCVKSGPFKDMKVNLGPVSPTLDGVARPTTGGGLLYNPRCLRRDISQYISSRWSTTSEIVKLILTKFNIADFQNHMQGDFANGFVGVHSAGHFTMGGDPGGDLFVSPGDPAFWVHHGMIDRVWWIWQNLNPLQRTYTIAGTLTLNNNPPSRDGTLDDTINMGVLDPVDRTLRSLASTTSGPYCYIYL